MAVSALYGSTVQIRRLCHVLYHFVPSLPGESIISRDWFHSITDLEPFNGVLRFHLVELRVHFLFAAHAIGARSCFCLICPTACTEPGQTCLSRYVPAIRCSFQRSSHQRPSSHRNRVISTSRTSAASFFQHQFEPLPRLPCLICSLVSMTAAAKPATHRSHWDFLAIEL